MMGAKRFWGLLGAYFIPGAQRTNGIGFKVRNGASWLSVMFSVFCFVVSHSVSIVVEYVLIK
jgi:hypothetical protein